MGGLGNQLFQLAFALNRYGDDKVAVTCTHGRPRRNNRGLAELSDYKLPANVSIEIEKENRFKAKLLRTGLIFSIKPNSSLGAKILNEILVFTAEILFSLLSMRTTNFVTSDNIGFGKIRKARKSNQDRVVGYFQSYRYLDNNTLSILKNLRLSFPHTAIEEYKVLASLEHPIVLHVRLGDYVNEPGIGLISSNYYHESIRLIREHFPTSWIWVFSNDLDGAKKLLGNIEDLRMRFVLDDWNSSAVTLEVMRFGHAFIIANSTFSYWAAMLNHNQTNLVVAPTPWFLGQPSPEQIIPPEWIRVKSE